MANIHILVPLEMPETNRAHLAERYVVHYWPDQSTHVARLQDPILQAIRGVQTNGSYGLKRPMIDAMPKLEIICAVGAGYEGIDLAAARERSIIVTHGPGTNSETVADQAWALLLGVMRRLPWCDVAVRAGRWREARYPMPGVFDKKIRVFGLGHVGMAVARRGALGFGMSVGYHNRKRRLDVPDYRYFDRLEDLARWCDVLVVAAPGGPGTRYAVNAEILAALGPQGYLINVARGSLVDNAVLAEALREGRIAGAGLDVIEGEPAVPVNFTPLERLVLSPHLGGYSPEAMQRAIELVRDNLDAHFSGKPTLTPVSDS